MICMLTQSPHERYMLMDVLDMITKYIYLWRGTIEMCLIFINEQWWEREKERERGRGREGGMNPVRGYDCTLKHITHSQGQQHADLITPWSVTQPGRSPPMVEIRTFECSARVWHDHTVAGSIDTRDRRCMPSILLCPVPPTIHD